MAVTYAGEPVGIMAAVNAAIASTLGVLTLTEVLEPEVAGGLGAALGAWILVGSLLLVRPKVTPYIPPEVPPVPPPADG